MRFQTLHQLIEKVEKEYQITFPTVFGGIGYNETARFCIEPNYEFSKLSHRSNKMLQVIINRLDDGVYELTSYIL